MPGPKMGVMKKYRETSHVTTSITTFPRINKDRRENMQRTPPIINRLLSFSTI